MQINMIDFPYYLLGTSRRKEFGIESNEALFDPFVNMKAAKRIYDTSGLTAWSVYRHELTKSISADHHGLFFLFSYYFGY